MKLISLTLQNFRQFYGRQTLHFSSGTDRNTTVIYGANGSGKTTLLNAFTWALYGKFTPAFENPQRLISEYAVDQAQNGSDIECSVEVVFDQNGDIYTAKRTQIERKNGSGSNTIQKGALTLDIRTAKGNTITRQNPQESIDQILPSDLYNFFFFDGERIEKLVQAQGKADIAKAIKSLLDLEVIERAIRHLSEAQRSLEKDIDDGPSSALSALRSDLERHRTDIEEANTKLAAQEQNVNAIATEIAEIDNRLRTLEHAKGLQMERDQIKRQIGINKKNIADVRNGEINKKVANEAFTVFLRDGMMKAAALVEDKRAKGQLPADISGVFLSDLLDAGRCICGTALVKGDEHYLRLLELKKTAGKPAVQEALFKLAGTCEYYQKLADPIFKTLTDAYSRIDQFEAEMLRLEERLSEISSTLKGKDQEDIASLEDRRASLLPRQRSCDQEIGRLKDNIKVINNIVRVKEKRLKDIEIKDEKVAKARDRVSVTMEVRNCLQEILELRTTSVRDRLNKQVTSVYRSITFKNYTPIIDHDFSLKLMRNNGSRELHDIEDPIAKSTGEAQLLSLAFVGSVANEAFTDHKTSVASSDSEPTLGSRGGFYPVVMDSPFGNLDIDYQAEVARALPALAPQVVVMVSRSQGRGVESELAPRVGKCYVVNFHTDKPELETSVLTAFGHNAPIITVDPEGPEWAELLLVTDMGEK